MEIPYNEELRPDTGLYNAKLGIWLFLASEVMLFGGLFSAYIMLRLSDPNWASYGQDALNVPLATLNTTVLITSSITMVMSWVSLKLNDLKKYKLYMGLTLLCSFGFLIIKYIEYSSKFSHGLFPSTNNFLAVYFVLTGLHMLHVIGGIVVNGYFFGPGLKMWNTEPERFTNRIEVAGLYWHFVDLVWIFLFPALYLL
ncbi:cytochrome c oxidase subunit 3 [Candidatus Marinimicrobia bacterium]|nr:cytochrome c oxidase subunit 3 [Candidatus Neomarinimicrobiota bacterium]|tara:strand:- start:10 stop:603 length:594 start_codon:yes stop_codon:yes gene_type:complete